MTLKQLHALGFDESTQDKHNIKQLHVRCSQCSTLVINGFPAHENGCPNEMHECKGCNNLVPKNVKYCEDCR